MATRIVDRLVLRGPTLADLPAAVALINAVSQAEEGITQTDEDQLRQEWEYGDFVPERDARFALDQDGTLIGYIELWPEFAAGRLHVWGCVHPAYQGQGIGAALLDWAETYAGSLLPQVTPGVPVTLVAATDSRNVRAIRLLTGRGYRVTRHFWKMVLDLDPYIMPELPAWPDGITIRPYFPKIDDRFVYRVVQESFRDHWGYTEQPFAEWRKWMTGGADFDPALWFLAVTTDSGGDEIIGAALCRPGLPEDPDMGWIRMLAVLREYRQQGIGGALLRYAIGEFHRLGKARVGLAVDAESLTGATRLYERVGMRVTRQRDRYERALRDGETTAAE